MTVAIIGARWPDVAIERDVLGVAEDAIVRDPGETQEAIVAAAAGADVILAGPHPRFDAATLDRLSCRGIVRYGVGYDNIDVAAATQKGIAVAFVPDYGTEAVALHATALALAGMRRIPALDRMVKARVWDFTAVRPLHLPAALTAGVIGFGRIGRLTARHFRDLGFGRTVAYDAHVAIHEPGIEATSLRETLAESDVLSLHAPGSQEGAPLIGRDEIALMRSGSVLVNTARGTLIDAAALVEGLRKGRPGVAALDVFDPEPADPASFAAVIDQVIMTPHVAWYTEESEQTLRIKTAEEGRRLLHGQPPLHPVLLPKEAS